MTRFIVAIFIMTLALPCSAAGLKVGDPAPAIKAARWIKGKPINLADGKDKTIYVVEFWATWCPPCRASIPHLTKLSNYFKKQDVVIIGVSVDGEQTKEKVDPFVKEQGKKMEYTVALDTDDGATNEAYMEAAKVQGIPHAFIVGKDGKIAWHGHPMDGLDLKLAELTGDKEYAARAEKLARILSDLQKAGKKEAWDDLIKKATEYLELDPENLNIMLTKYHVMALKKGDTEGASKFGHELVKKVEEPDFFNQLSWVILTNDDFEGKRDLKLALAAAEKANELTGKKNFAILDTYARALFMNGNAKEAVEAEKKAIKIAEEEKAGDEQLEDLKNSLEEFEKGPAKKDAEKKDGDKDTEK